MLNTNLLVQHMLLVVVYFDRAQWVDDKGASSDIQWVVPGVQKLYEHSDH